MDACFGTACELQGPLRWSAKARTASVGQRTRPVLALCGFKRGPRNPLDSQILTTVAELFAG